MDELIHRANRGEASAAELAQLDAWRRASADHERQYQEVVRLLDVARSLAAGPTTSTGATGPVPKPPPAAEIIARVASRPGRRVLVRRVMRWAPWAVAAAATILAAVGLRSRGAGEAVPGWGATEVVTGASELATVQLGDGSVVRLAPSSRLRVAAGREREVTLEGRAFFAVERIPRHPLRVHTRAGEARVLGTRFELATDHDRLQLRVVEGRVALSTRRNHIEVNAGEESEVRDGAVVRPTRIAPTGGVGTWVGTFLAFQATPLRDAAREIERVYGTPVTIADSTLAVQTITATFTDRPVQEVVNVVCSVLNARCEVRDGRVWIER